MNNRVPLQRILRISTVLVVVILGTVCGVGAQPPGLAENSYEASAMRKVQALVNSGKREQAIEILSNLIKNDPNNLRYLQARGMCYGNLERWDKAVADFSAILKVRPAAARTRVFRGITYVRMREFELGKKDLDLAIAHDDKEAVPFMWRGIARAQVLDMKGAIVDLKKSISIEPINRAYFAMGGANIGLGNVAEAKACYDYVLKHAPKNGLALMLRGRCHHVLKEYDEALKDYRRALIYRPGYWRIYAVRADTYEKLGQHDKAAADVDNATLNEPELSAEFFEVSVEHSMQKANKKTSVRQTDKYLEKAIKLRDSNDYEGARLELGKAIAANPDDFAARLWRGRISLLMHKYDDALKDLIVVQHSGDTAISDAEGLCGLAYLGKKNYERALAGINGELFWNENWLAGHYHKGVVLEAMKRPKEAMESYKRFLSGMKNADIVRKSREKKSELTAYQKLAEAKVGKGAASSP